MRVVAALLCHVPKSVGLGAEGDFGHFQAAANKQSPSMPMVAFDWQCILVSYSDLSGA